MQTNDQGQGARWHAVYSERHDYGEWTHMCNCADASCLDETAVSFDDFATMFNQQADALAAAQAALEALTIERDDARWVADQRRQSLKRYAALTPTEEAK